MLEKILTSCEYVVDNSKHVSINKENIRYLTDNISKINMSHWLVSSPFGLLDLPVDVIVNFLLIFEAIDFSFWGNPKWSIQTETGSLDGSIALLYSLLKYVKENKTTDLSNIKKNEFANILKGNIEIPLLEERLKIVRQVSKTVNKKMNGNFYKYIENINSDCELFEIIISNFPNFKDERIYDGKKIYFYKLAQLLTSDILHIREIKEKIKMEYSHLIGCADYRIPQVLREMGILIYDKELTNFVDKQIELPINSEYEVEIRANMLIVIDMIYEQLKGKYSHIDINDYLFMKKNDKNLILKPYHLSRCINY